MSKNKIKKAKDQRQTQIFFIVIGGTFIILALVFFIIVPAITSVVEQIKNNEVRREMITNQERKIKKITNLIEIKNSYSQELVLLEESYPTFDDTEFIARNLYDYDESNNEFTITNMKFEKEGSTININLNYETSYEQAFIFLDFIEKFPRILQVESISYTYDENEESELPLIGNMKLIAYFQSIQDNI